MTIITTGSPTASGGLLLEPIVLPKFPIHLSFPVLLGAGGIATNEPKFSNYSSQAFLIAEPGVEIEMNLIRFVRLAVGASYRFTSNINIDKKPKDLLNGYNATISLKIGKF